MSGPEREPVGGQSPGPAKLPPPEVGPARNPQPSGEPLGSRAGDPRSQAGQWTPADLLDHHREFALAVGAALAAPGISDMMRLVRITVAHSRLVRAVR